MGIRTIIRWVVTSLSLFVVAPIISVNVETLATKKGWNNFLTELWPNMTAQLHWVNQPVVYSVAGILIGITLTMWVIRWIPDDQMVSTQPSVKVAPTMVDFEGPTYSLYDDRARFSLLEAACLWGDITPNDNSAILDLFPEAKAGYKLLSEAIQDGRLNCYSTSKNNKLSLTRDPQPSWIIMRDDLLKFSSSLGKRPRFLYPESRHWMS